MAEHAILQVQPTVPDDAGPAGSPVRVHLEIEELPNNVMEASIVPVDGHAARVRHDTLARFPGERGAGGLGSEDACDLPFHQVDEVQPDEDLRAVTVSITNRTRAPCGREPWVGESSAEEQRNGGKLTSSPDIRPRVQSRCRVAESRQSGKSSGCASWPRATRGTSQA